MADFWILDTCGEFILCYVIYIGKSFFKCAYFVVIAQILNFSCLTLCVFCCFFVFFVFFGFVFCFFVKGKC